MVDISWTAEEAMKAQEAFEALKPAMARGPAGPIFQWAALHKLEELRTRFSDGDQFSLMLALRVCANHDLAMPEWVWRAYIKAFDRVLNYEVGSWDEAFGRPIPRGAQLPALRSKRMKSYGVYRFCKEKIQAGTPVDTALFEAAGQEFSVSGSTAKTYYYECKKAWDSSVAGRVISKKIQKARKDKFPA